MRRLGSLGLLALVWLAASGFVLDDPVYEANRRGNQEMAAGRSEEAIKAYLEALREDRPEVHYNLGGALLAAGQPDKAAAELSIALAAEDPELRRAAFNNRGVARVHLGDLEGALEDFAQALRIDPADETVRANLELGLRLAEEQPTPEPQPQNQPSDGEPQPPEGTPSPGPEQQSSPGEPPPPETPGPTASPEAGGQDQAGQASPTPAPDGQPEASAGAGQASPTPAGAPPPDGQTGAGEPAEPAEELSAEELSAEQARQLLDLFARQEMEERQNLKLRQGRPVGRPRDW